MHAKWDYGGAIDRWPVEMGKPIVYPDGSTLLCKDLTKGEVPEFMKQVDILFVDGPWNLGNLKSFYTKADEKCSVHEFSEFYCSLFSCIKNINPKLCYLEIGKEFVGDYIVKLKRLYRYVTLYNSGYYHKKENRCYVVQGSNKRLNLHLDDMDEEDIIDRLGDVTEGSMGDLCMGRGLVALSAAKRGRRFFGTELNPKRLAVCVERLAKMGVTPVEGIGDAS